MLGAAAEELEATARYYDAIEPGLGLRFVHQIEAAIARLRENPKAYLVAFARFRRCRVQVFPFNLFYVIREQEILLLAIAHAKRKPGY
ncbi:MAG: type II toxin-antitoxin system RelE/ParE family toxin [Opitutales bacterium]